jgi:hypothetical protein
VKKQVLRGQIGLLLLVIMGVVVALVMSVASRSLSDTVLSRQERESSAAFAVAETGIETAMNAIRDPLSANLSGSLSDISGFATGNYQTNLTTYDLFVKELESAHLDTSGAAGSLTIYWTKKGDTSENVACSGGGTGGAPSAIEVSAIRSTGVVRSYYNPNGCDPEANGFDTTTAVDGGAIYKSKIDYTIPAGTVMVRIKPIYNGATIAVSGLANQMYLIQSEVSGGDAQKEIEVRRGLNSPPAIFDFAVFAKGTIVK